MNKAGDGDYRSHPSPENHEIFKGKPENYTGKYGSQHQHTELLQIPLRRYLDIPAKHLAFSRRRYLFQNGPLPDEILRLRFMVKNLPCPWAGTHRVICQDFVTVIAALPQTQQPSFA
jgi:hypothetical protein